MKKQLEEDIRNLIRHGEGRTGVIIRGLDEDRFNLTFNEDQVFPSASIIKVPIATVVLRQNADNILDLRKKICVTKNVLVGGSGALQYLTPGFEIRLEDALVLSLIMSDNVATNIMIDAAGGLEALNKHWISWGLMNTKINRYMMDFDSRGRGIDNWTSPRDMTMLFEWIYRRRLLPSCQTDRLLDILAGQQVNHKLPDDWPENVWFAHKTGELSIGIEHDIGILRTLTGAYIVTVLTSDFPTNFDALHRVRMLGKLVRKYLIKGN